MAEQIIPKIYCMSLHHVPGGSYEKGGEKWYPCKVFHSTKGSDKEKRERSSVAHLEPKISFAKPYPTGTSTTQLTKDKNNIRDSLGFRVTSDAIKKIIGKEKKKKRRREKEEQDLQWVLATEESLTHISGQSDLNHEEWNTFLERGSHFDIKKYRRFLPDIFRLRKRKGKRVGYEVVIVRKRATSKNGSAKTEPGPQPKPLASSNERQNENQKNETTPGCSVDNRLSSIIVQGVPDSQEKEIPPDDDDVIFISEEPPSIKEPVKVTDKKVKAEPDSVSEQNETAGHIRQSHHQSAQSETRQDKHDKKKDGINSGKKSNYDQTSSTSESPRKDTIVPQKSNVTKAGTSKDTHVHQRKRNENVHTGQKHHVSEKRDLSVIKNKRLPASILGDNSKAGTSREESEVIGSDRNHNRARQAGVGQTRSVQEQGHDTSKPSTSTARTINQRNSTKRIPSGLPRINNDDEQSCKNGKKIGERQLSKDAKTVAQRMPGLASSKDKPLPLDSIMDQIDSTRESRRSLYREQEEISEEEPLDKKFKYCSTHHQQSDVPTATPPRPKHEPTTLKRESSATGNIDGPETLAEDKGTNGNEGKSGKNNRDSGSRGRVKRSETSDAACFTKAGTSYERNERMAKEINDSSSHKTRNVTLLVGDSMLQHVQENLFKSKDVVVKVITGARVNSISDKITRFVQQESPRDVILHIGTLELEEGAQYIAEHIESVGRLITTVGASNSMPKFTISSIIQRRNDATKGTDPSWATVSKVNRALRDLQSKHGWDYIDNHNIMTGEHLLKDGIHLNPSGIEAFVGNILKHLQKVQGKRDMRSSKDMIRRNSWQKDGLTRHSDSQTYHNVHRSPGFMEATKDQSYVHHDSQLVTVGQPKGKPNKFSSSPHSTDDRRVQDDGCTEKPNSSMSRESSYRRDDTRHGDNCSSSRQLQGSRQDWTSHTRKPNTLYPGYSGCHFCGKFDHKKKDCPSLKSAVSRAFIPRKHSKKR